MDDRKVFSGIVLINRNGFRWRDVPPAYDPPKRICNRCKRRSGNLVFVRMLLKLTR